MINVMVLHVVNDIHEVNIDLDLKAFYAIVTCLICVYLLLYSI